jgi:hypothetical protein
MAEDWMDHVVVDVAGEWTSWIGEFAIDTS